MVCRNRCLLVLLIAALSLPPRGLAQALPVIRDADAAALRAAVEQYFAAFAEENLDALARRWSADSPHRAARLKELEKLFTENDRLAVKDLAIRTIKTTAAGEAKATVRASLTVIAVDSKTGKPANGLGRLNRSLQFVQAPAGWLLWREQATEEELAAALTQSRSEAELATLLTAEKEFLTIELTQTLYRQGTRLRGQGRYDEALASYRLSQRVSAQIAYPIGVATAEVGFGSVYAYQLDYAKALDYFSRALALSDNLDDRNLRLSILNNLGGMYQNLGETALALDFYRRSLALAEASGNQDVAISTLRNLGTLFYRQGNYAAAMSHLQKSITLSQASHNEGAVAITLDALGAVYLSQGNDEQALACYERLLAMVEKSGQKFALIAALAQLTRVHTARGEYGKAVAYGEKNLQLAEGTNLKSLLFMAARELGRAYYGKGEAARAIPLLERSLEITEASGAGDEFANDLLSLSLAYYATGDAAKAQAFAERAAAIARASDAPQTAANAQSLVGRIYNALKQPQRAREAFAAAIADIESLRSHVAGSAQAQQQFLERHISPYYEMVNLLVAGQQVGEAFDTAERAKARALLDVLQSGRVDIRKAMSGEQQERERHLRIRVNSLNAQLGRAAPSAKPAAAAERSALQAQLRQARLDYEAFQTELYAIHPELKVRRGEARTIRSEEVGELLPDADTALLEYVVTATATQLFVLTKTAADKVEMRVFTIPLSEGELTAQAREFRRQLATRDLHYKEAARRLYDLLLKPARAQLQGKSHLVIVPDRSLWELPFQTLVGDNNRHLIEEAAVSYAPSLTVLREMTAQRRQRAARQSAPSARRATAELFAIGNPVFEKATAVPTAETTGGSAPVASAALRDTQLPRLPEAEREVKTLAALYGAPQSRIYVGADAREDLAKAEAANYRVLHFATHGVLNDAAPLYSHLLLSPGGKDEDGLLEAWELMEMDWRADLVVLSACETARGRVSAGEGVIGLSWALFVAGCPTTVASQWKVDSASTTELMLEFHRNLKTALAAPKPAASKAEALRRAALKLMRTTAYRHPFHWAGFVIVGDSF